MRHATGYEILALLVLITIPTSRALAQADLVPVDVPITVALPESGDSVLFSNNSAAAIDEEGNIGIAYTNRGEVDSQVLDIFTPDDGLARHATPDLPFTWRDTPVVAAAPMNTFIFTRYTPGDGTDPEVVTDLVTTPGLATKFHDGGEPSQSVQTAANVIRLKLSESMDCTVTRIAYSERRYEPLESVPFREAGIFVPTGSFPVGDIFYVHCLDGRTFAIKPDWSTYPDIDFAVYPIEDGANKLSMNAKAPPASLPIIAAGLNSSGNVIAYYGQPLSGGATALITVAESDESGNESNVIQIDDPAPSLFPGPVLATCGYDDRPHYWVVYLDDRNRAVAARIEGDSVEVNVLGENAGPLDIACDNWGNAVVSWLRTNESFDYFVRTAVIGPGGSVLDSHDQALPPDDFPNPQFAVVSNDINQGGEIVVAWSNGGFGVFFRTYKLDGHFAIDGTLSGSHYSPAFSGEGFIFDVIELQGQPKLVVYYFTYNDDDSGDPTWLVGQGPIEGNRAVVEMITGRGATFGSGFDPDDVERLPAGTVIATFLSCGLVVVEADSNRFGQQAYIAGPLTGRPLEVDGQCGQGPDGTAQVDASRGGSLYTPSRSGEGFIFDIVRVNGVPTLVAYYFTYQPDGSGNPAWMVGQGPIEGDSATLTMTIAEGASFGPDFDPADVVRTEWGEITVTFQTCENVLVEYDGLWGEGSFNVGPLTPPLIGATGLCAP